MTRDEYRKYLTERIAVTEDTIQGVSDAQDAGLIGGKAADLALELAKQLDHLKHDLYYLDNEGGVSNG